MQNEYDAQIIANNPQRYISQGDFVLVANPTPDGYVIGMMAQNNEPTAQSLAELADRLVSFAFDLRDKISDIVEDNPNV